MSGRRDRRVGGELEHYGRLLRVPAAQPTRDACVSFLTSELGTDSLERARSSMEDALRMTTHLIMSTPEYQIV